MTTLTSPAALPPIVATPAAAAAEGTPAILNILAARAVGELNSPLVQTLQDAAGPGNIIAGTVAESAADGTATVTTQNGSSVTFHHPPEIPLEPGAAVVLRLLLTTTTPQAVLLAVNGRPITLRGPAAATGSGSSGVASGAAKTVAAPPAGAATVAASFIATISLEDEAALETALTGDGITLDGASNGAGADTAGPTVVATLIRPAPAKLGQTPVPSGTRYLVTLREIGNADAAAPVASRSTAAPGPTTAPGTGAARPAAAPAVPSAPEPPVSAGATVLLALQAATDPLAEMPPAPAFSGLAQDVPVEPPPLPAEQPRAAPQQPTAPEATGSPATPEAAPLDLAVLSLAETAAPSPEAEPVPPTPPIPAPPATTTPAPAADLPAGVPSPAQATAQTPIGPPAEELTVFRPQITTLAGRVIAPQTAEETLVETPIGTLALPLPAPLPLGVAVQLRVTAIAPPQSAEQRAAGHATAASPPEPSASTFDATPPTLVEELARVLTPSAPAAIGEIHAALALNPGDGLAAAILSFLTGLGRSPPLRAAESPARRALITGGRKDLAERLDRARGDIGTTRPSQGPDGWTVMVLPFLGTASVRPMRLYRKRHDDKDAEGRSRNKPSDRFMLEVELKRMGPLQFDGLVRERRFDLVVRSRDPFLPPLQRQIEQAFQDGLLISGWSGEIGFGRIGTFPMMPDPDSAAHLDLGA